MGDPEMKTMKKIFAVAILSGALFSQAHATVLTFDDLGLVFGDTFVGNEYAGFGINFSTPDVRLGIGTTTGSSPNSMGAHETAGNDFNGQIDINFDAGFFVTDLMFTIFNTPFEASAFDVGGNLLSTIVSGPDFTQLFDFSGHAVNSVVITGTLYAIDDVTFGDLQAVTEPGTLALLGIGLLGFGFARRVKKV
jgi:hypothetical protein